MLKPVDKVIEITDIQLDRKRCYVRRFQKMISVKEALALLDEHRPDWGNYRVNLSKANGCILAEDIIAPAGFPAQAVSVMDGYAIRKSDREHELTLIGESRAGVPFEGQVKSNETVRIFTGAVIPKGADQVEIQENANLVDDKTIRFTARQANRNYIRPADADFKTGDLLFRKGERVTPEMILGLATCNLAKVLVKKPPSIALLSSGDEMKPIGSKLGTGEIINSILPALTARLNEWGLAVMDLGIATDDPKDIRDKIEKCSADIIVPIGAASVGDYDFMKPTALDLGFKPIFSKVAVKPGKPTWYSRRSDQCILGLPGNPSSAWVASHLFLYYLIFGDLPWTKRKLASDIPRNGPRESYIRARLLSNGTVMPLNRQDSGLVTPLHKANCLIRRPSNSDELEESERVEVLKLK